MLVLELSVIAVWGPLFLMEDTGEKADHRFVSISPSKNSGAGSCRLMLPQVFWEQRGKAHL